MSLGALETRPDLYPSRNGGKPAWLERQDPIVHTAGGDAGPLGAERTRDYEREGFAVLEQLFDGAEIEALRAESARLRGTSTDIDPELTIAEPQDSTLRTIFRVHALSPVFDRLVRDARLVSIAEHMLGGDVYIHQTRLNYKPGFAGKEFYWHSDFETWHVEDGMPRMRAMSVSISLSDNAYENGPLMLIPGSHRHYIACAGETPEEHFRQSLRKQEYGVPDPASLEKLATQGGIRSVVGPAGTATLFDCNTMHGSNGNITPFPRSNVFIVYNSVENAVEAPFGPSEPRPEFLAERTSFDPIEPLSGPIPGV